MPPACLRLPACLPFPADRFYRVVGMGRDSTPQDARRAGDAFKTVALTWLARNQVRMLGGGGGGVWGGGAGGSGSGGPAAGSGSPQSSRHELPRNCWLPDRSCFLPLPRPCPCPCNISPTPPHLPRTPITHLPRPRRWRCALLLPWAPLRSFTSGCCGRRRETSQHPWWQPWGE